ncbi:MAG: class I SAM-dependent methyltransferase [Gemmataceae bacterium]
MTATAPAVTLPNLNAVPFARGYIEHLMPLDWKFALGGWEYTRTPNRIFRPRGLFVTGWMLLPDGPFEKIAAYVNGQEFFTCVPQVRPDLSSAFPHVPNADKAGFTFKIPSAVARRGRLMMVGRRKGQPVGKMLMHFRDDLPWIVPTPPPDLTDRVVGTRKAYFFLAQGYKSFGEIKDAVARHRPLHEIRRILDWGCGPGRLTAHWLRRKEKFEVHGCDIDPQHIAWCGSNLRRGQFARVDFTPPTLYPDAHFDAVFGYSVFTHLTREAQHLWLAEIRRILTPGGVFVATVQGPSAAWFVFGDKSRDMLATGIHDGTVDPGMEAVVGEGAYRSTYQTPEWTRETFGHYFDVLEYAERAIGNNQDLIVLRRR